MILKLFGKLTFLMFCLALSLQSFGQADDYVQSMLKARAEKDAELKHKKTSPLQVADRKRYTHLNYFDIDTNWRKEAQYHRIENGEILDFATTNGAIKKFQKHGFFTFSHNGVSDTLFAYKRIYPEGYIPNYPPYLFVPFKDFTSGEECYGGGRYIETEVFEIDQVVVLDFNTCYNPYCAYGGGFACPIPPSENYVNCKVEAGEKAYDSAEH